jgi:hypothetical protein
MKPAFFLIALLFGGILLAPSDSAAAADSKTQNAKIWRYSIQQQELPFARGERAQSVWAGGACWTECGSHCVWGMAGCLVQDAQGRCLKLTDACDRYCQRECRSSGGPLLPVDFWWE